MAAMRLHCAVRQMDEAESGGGGGLRTKEQKEEESHLHDRKPGSLRRSVQLPKQEKRDENRPRTEGPTGPCNGKQMAVSSDGSRLQSAVQERKLLIGFLSKLHPPAPVIHLQTGPVAGSSIDTVIQA
ncbi:unnamed protein product [Tetraodon nigroviridis]|uniref:(spotted green pufferfish) hypothetical protein n=1 Tax=Tetraodon nigroviridis TaxID=99883 RepID=Q4SA76_TETNG|nr:unnamed protein product [Tetraodon nigroviridis]